MRIRTGIVDFVRLASILQTTALNSFPRIILLYLRSLISHAIVVIAHIWSHYNERRSFSKDRQLPDCLAIFCR